MTIEYGDFNNYKNWVALPCSSGGYLYAPLGADGQPIYAKATSFRPNFDGIITGEFKIS